MEIRRIQAGSGLHAQARELRERELLAPIGLSLARFDAEFPEADRLGEHWAAVMPHPAGERVVGTALLLADFPGAGVGKLMQMAVDRQRQGEGIGRRLVVAIERRAFGELGLRELFCHAREDVAGFYRSVGWRERGERFEEVGIPHVKMAIGGTEVLG